jgi:hypothetical protein
MKYLFLLGLLLFSCSPEKRLNHLIEKHPELAKDDTIKIAIHKDAVLIDTVIKKDSNCGEFDLIRIDKTSIVQIDSAIKGKVSDSIITEINKIASEPRLKTSTIHRKNITATVKDYGDSIGLSIHESAIDTIVAKPYKKYEIVKSNGTNWWMWGWIIFFLIILIVLFYSFYQAIK